MYKLRILPWRETVMLLQATACARDCEPTRARPYAKPKVIFRVTPTLQFFGRSHRRLSAGADGCAACVLITTVVSMRSRYRFAGAGSIAMM